MTTASRVPSLQASVRAGSSDVVSAMGRFGYAAKAFVYTIVGLLVLRLAFGGSGEEASAQGAFDTLGKQPMGPWLVGLTAVGLAVYALWRLTMVFIGTVDSDLPEGFQRAGWAVSAISNGVLAFAAAKQVLGGGSSGSSKSTGTLFELPGGVVLVGLIGLAIIGFGINQGRQAATGEWTDRHDFGPMSSRQRNVTIALGKAGHAGRALAWNLTGAFLLHSAITFDPNEPVGLDAALREVQQAAWGLPVLLAVAVGLAAYGLWCGTVTLWGDPDA